MAEATSSGWPKRCSGYFSRIASRNAGSSSSARVIGVSIIPGQTQLTRTPGAHCIAICRVRFTTAPLDAAYAGESEPPTTP
jgi:hypothetical protein